MHAIDNAVCLAESRGAVLVPVSLVSIPESGKRKGARLEDIQQSKDFLEATWHKAERYGVTLERYEVFTSDVLQSIAILIHNLHCDGIVLASSGEQAVLLDTGALQHLLEEPPATLLLIRLPAQTRQIQLPRLVNRFLSWLRPQSVPPTTLRRDERGQRQKPQRKEETGMSGARILLVEDDEILRDLVQRNLEAREHEVSIAEDAQTALAHLKTAPFDLVVLDINLPDHTGWDVLRIAQREGWLRPQKIDGDDQKLPVVVLSAVRVSPHRLVEVHPLAYLPKPFPMDALLRLAAEAARRRSAPSDTDAAVNQDDNAGAQAVNDQYEHETATSSQNP